MPTDPAFNARSARLPEAVCQDWSADSSGLIERPLFTANDKPSEDSNDGGRDGRGFSVGIHYVERERNER